MDAAVSQNIGVIYRCCYGVSGVEELVIGSCIEGYIKKSVIDKINK